MEQDFPRTTEFSHCRAGRVASYRHRDRYELSREFVGIEKSVNRYDLLLLVKKLGKAGGFTPRMIQLLDHYMAFTQTQDWEEGSRPIVYQSLSRTALELGVSERQIQKLENRLFEVGAITWNDSGNHKRHGYRDKRTGRIAYAFGVDLSPLAAIRADLENKLAEKQSLQSQWMQTKRKISWYRSQIRAMISAKAEEGSCVIDAQACYEEIAIQIRTHLGLPELITLCTRHKDLFDELNSQWSDVCVDTSDAVDDQNEVGETFASISENSSLTNEQKFAHKQPNHSNIKFNKLKRLSPGTGFQESKQEKPVPNNRILSSEIDQLQLSEVVHAASERFKERLLVTKPSWTDVVETAARLASTLGITQTAWGNACQSMGRQRAAICVMRVDLACQRRNNPVLHPNAYFYAMINNHAL